MAATGETQISAPEVNKRFIVKVPFNNRRTGRVTMTNMLNAEGYLDYAQQCGLVKLDAKIIERWTEDSVVKIQDRDENNKPIPGTFKDVVQKTRWCIAQATCVVLRSGVSHTKRPILPEDTIVAVAHASANDRDQFVKQPGYEVQVAETRAKKRAIADACNLTEMQISPDADSPTREAVDMPLPKTETGAMGDGIPGDMKRQPDISPPLHGEVTHPADGSSEEEQFTI